MRFGSLAALRCILHDDAQNTVKSIVWQHNDVNIMRHDANVPSKTERRYISTISENNSDACLKIQDMGYGDAGNYTCLVFFTQGSSRSSTWFLHVQGINSLNCT